MSKYEKNETMRLLGHTPYTQCLLGYDRTEPIHNAFMEDMKPFDRVPIREMMLDSYLLGFMDGKREERARRKGKA